MEKGTLYLIPTLLGDEASTGTLAGMNTQLIRDLRFYIAENAKSARKFLKQAGIPVPLQEIAIEELNEHTPIEEISSLLEPLRKGKDVGLVSEAGCPAIADPGAQVVRIAHKEAIRVVPVPGPSSILLALMGSGFNGQQFTFNGYLPKENDQRSKKIKEMERLARNGNTQLFMDVPYRNDQVLNDLISSCDERSMLCIATDITLPTEDIRSKTIAGWKKQKPGLHKRLVIFALGN
ncbi:MAG: SAM-dependent methyltransferase [Flavobacteriales bacterium]